MRIAMPLVFAVCMGAAAWLRFYEPQPRPLAIILLAVGVVAGMISMHEHGVRR